MYLIPYLDCAKLLLSHVDFHGRPWNVSFIEFLLTHQFRFKPCDRGIHVILAWWCVSQVPWYLNEVTGGRVFVLDGYLCVQ